MLSFLLLFTPLLGLFDTLHHARLATLDFYGGQRTYETSPVTNSIAWEPLKIKDISDFPEMHLITMFSTGIMVCICLLHTIASTSIQKVTIRDKFSARLLMQGLHSFIVSPLQFDWELLYRTNKHNMSILNCWRR